MGGFEMTIWRIKETEYADGTHKFIPQFRVIWFFWAYSAPGLRPFDSLDDAIDFIKRIEVHREIYHQVEIKVTRNIGEKNYGNR